MPGTGLWDAPVGTMAPAITGGRWYRTVSGWKWNGPDGTGSTFPTPGGDWTGELVAPGDPDPDAFDLDPESAEAPGTR